MIETELKENDMALETRAWVENKKSILANLERIGARFITKLEIIDEIYANLEEFSIEEHTYEKDKRAARIRTLTKDDKTECIANIREAVISKETEDLGLHDLTITTLSEKASVREKKKLVDLIQQKGFDTLIKSISKTRQVYTLEEKIIFMDDIENYASALEIKTKILNLKEAIKTKREHIEILKKLGVEESDFINKSYTHLILDSHLKQNPQLRIPQLRKLLRDLEKKKAELLLNSEEHYREGGDGWHDNASWDALLEQINVVSAKMANIRTEIMELSKLK